LTFVNCNSKYALLFCCNCFYIKNWNYYHKTNYPKIALNSEITPIFKIDTDLVFTPLEAQLNFVYFLLIHAVSIYAFLLSKNHIKVNGEKFLVRKWSQALIFNHLQPIKVWNALFSSGACFFLVSDIYLILNKQ
jgi:hypothetical protein